MQYEEKPLRRIATVIMGTSPDGSTYNRNGDGRPLLNGPTEFGTHHPTPVLYTTASTRECEPGDLIFCVRGSTTGRMNWADRVYSLGRGVCAIRGASASDTHFIRYCIDLKLPALLKLAGGGTFPNLTRDTILDFPLPFPSQRGKITAVLTAYDDLVENNTRRIQVLEEMAQALYREWFVHFRFPGHEQTEMVDSALRPIPEGWEATTIGDVVGIMGGGTPSTADPDLWTGGSVTWYSPSDLTAANSMFITRSEKMITPLGLQKSSARLFPPYCVMMTSRATIGVVSINTSEACTNQGFITCIPSARVSALQLYFWVKENKEKIISMASGATFKEINKATFRNLSIVVADPDTTTRFEGLVGSLGKQIENLLRKNTNLRLTRDLLLPKLISGEVSVDDLDIETGEADSTEAEAEGASRALSA